MPVPSDYRQLWPIKKTGNADNERTQINRLFEKLINDKASDGRGVSGQSFNSGSAGDANPFLVPSASKFISELDDTAIVSPEANSLLQYSDNAWTSFDVDTVAETMVDTLVPYEGATADIDLGNFDIVWPFQVGTPSSFTSYREYIENSSSAGIIDGCQITDNGDGTVDIGSGIALLRNSNDRLADLYTVEVTAQTNLSLTDDSVNYIYLDWNAGSPQFAVSTSTSSFNGIDKVVAYIIHRDGTNIDYLDLERQNLDVDARLLEYYLDTTRFTRVGSGSILDSTNLNITVSAGSFYFVLREVTHPAFDTSGSDTFSYFYRDGAGGWTETTGNTAIDVLQYDDGTGTLASLNANDYGVAWVYLLLDEDPELDVLYGQDNYEKLANALAASPPSSLPGKIESLGKLIGRVIFEQNDTALMPESVFEATFGFTTPISHNGLTGLQGGSVGERYHLNETEHERITGGSSLVTTTSYKVSESDSVVIVDDDAAGSTVTVSLPGVATAGDGYDLVVFKKGSTAIVTITGGGSDTINGESSFDLRVQYESIKLYTDGTEWFIIEA